MLNNQRVIHDNSRILWASCVYSLVLPALNVFLKKKTCLKKMTHRCLQMPHVLAEAPTAMKNIQSHHPINKIRQIVLPELA
jgi:hypothetical protein